MIRFVAIADAMLTATVTAARSPTVGDRVSHASNAAAAVNGMIPANQSRGSEAAFAPASRPTPTASRADRLRVRRTRYAASTAAVNGFVTW